MNIEIVEINVGGRVFTTSSQTLKRSPVLNDALTRFNKKSVGQDEERKLRDFTSELLSLKDSTGRLFIDRDPDMFSYMLQYLRDQRSIPFSKNNVTDPSWIKFLREEDKARLLNEAVFYRLDDLAKYLRSIDKHNANDQLHLPRVSSPESIARCHSENEIIGNVKPVLQSQLSTTGPSFLSIGYRGTFTVSRDSMMDKFRRITRITVSGRANTAKEVFQDDINDSRDPDRQPSDGYTSRYYLKHTLLEKAFEQLLKARFRLVTCNTSGAKTVHSEADEFKQWTSFIEYVFCRES